jgi:hypothetical protein
LKHEKNQQGVRAMLAILLTLSILLLSGERKAAQQQAMIISKLNVGLVSASFEPIELTLFPSLIFSPYLALPRP